MRVASRTIYDKVKYNLANINEKMVKANQIVSTGKTMNNLSDDPIGLTQSLQIKSNLANIDQLGRNITLGSSWLKASESALTQIQDILSDAKALAVQMATSTTGQAQRISSATTVQNMLDEVIALANTQVSGRYIFSGSKTDTAPFETDGTYVGDNTPFSIRIGKGETFKIGNDGESVFGTLFTTLTSFTNALASNDVDGIKSAMDNLDSEFDQVTNAISDAGTKSDRLATRQNILADLKISSTDRLSNIQDADITEAIMELKERELAYQAALSSSARVMDISLVDYLE